MSTELKHNRSGDILTYKGDLPIDAFIRLPVGTIGWAVSYQSYKSFEAARMVLSLGSAAWKGAPAGDDSRVILKRLLAGEAIECVGPPESGGMSISTYQNDMPAPATVFEHMLHLNSICIPGGSILRFESTIYLDAKAAAPVPDPEQVEFVQLVVDSGLATALRSLFPGQRDEAIAKQCEAAGYTAALRKFMALARGGA